MGKSEYLKDATRNPGKPVILSEAKNLAGITKILRFAQNDKFAKKNCRTLSQTGSPSANDVPCRIMRERRRKGPSSGKRSL
jgi:hypothetical protein